MGEDGKKTSLIVGEKGDNIAISGKIDVKQFKYISTALNFALNPKNGADSWVKDGPGGGKDIDKIKSSSGRGRGCNGEAACYSVSIDDRKKVTGFERTTAVGSGFAAINGMLNTVGYAMNLMGGHVKDRFESKNYTLIYNPTEGFFRDAIESARDKFGATTEITKAFANVLASTESNTSWIAHSQGGIIFSEAVRFNLANGVQTMGNNSVSFDSGANNAWVTNRYLVKAGIGLVGRGYYDAPNDLVPQIVGLRGWNRPDRVISSFISSPLLFTTHSPHTNAQP